jgi:hypothetical protein
MANKKVKFELTAVDKTKAAFDKVTKGLKGVGSVAVGASKGVAGIGLAATASATALAVLVDKSFQAVDAIGKTSTQTGIATDTLQAFHLAARESGTTIEGANTALIKFARSVGDAQRGVKTQSDIFKDLGVELRNADGSMKSFDDILQATAKGVTQLGDQTARATALANLFGRQGVVLTGAINDLSESGLKNFITRAKELGIVLSEKVIRRTEEFNDAVGVIKMQLGSFVNNITTSFLPVFEEMQKFIAEKIQKIVDEAGGMDKLGAKIAKAIIEFVAVGIEKFGTFRDEVASFVNDVKIKLIEVENSFLSLVRNVLRKLPARLGDFTKEMEDMGYTIIFNNKAIKDLEGSTTSYGKKAKLTADGVRKYKDDVDELIGSQDDATESSNGLALATDNIGKSLTNIQSPIDMFKQQLKDTEKSLDTIAVNSMKKFEDSIVEGLKTGKLAFKDFATYVVEQLIRVAIQQIVVAKLLDPFRTFIDDVFNIGDTVKGNSKTLQAPQDILEGLMPKITLDGGGYTGMGARAGGVDGKGGFPAILHPNETVIDHTKGQTVGGATVNFNISTVDAAGFDQLLTSRKGLITSIINNAMNTQGKMGVV